MADVKRWNWFRHERAEVKNNGGNIVIGDYRDEYNPFDFPNLPNAFAKVDGAKSAVNFIKKYGALGYIFFKQGESEMDNKTEEPLDWILPQAKTVRFTLFLLASLQNQDSKQLNALLKGATVKVRFDHADLIARYNVNVKTNDTISYEFAEGADIIIRNYSAADMLINNQYQFALEILTHLINVNTKKVRRRLFLDNDIEGKISQQLSSRSLIEVIWYHVGDAALLLQEKDDKSIRICQECGLPFIVTDKRQKFCPGDDFSSGSSCGIRYRVRKSRKKKGDAQNGQGKAR